MKRWTRLAALVLVAAANLVVAQNMAPVVDAGRDDTTRLGRDGFRFQGVVTDDGLPAGSSVTVLWSMLSGPATLNADSGDWYPDAERSLLKFSVKGTYVFKLSASDGVLSSSDTVKITVLDSIPYKVKTPSRAGEKILIGSQYLISWQIDPPRTDVVISLSINNGFTYNVEIAPNRFTDSTFLWTVSDTIPVSDSCILKVRQYFTNKTAYSPVFSIVRVAGASHEMIHKHGSTIGLGIGSTRETFSLDGRLLSPASGLASPATSGAVIHRFTKDATVRKTVVLK